MVGRVEWLEGLLEGLRWLKGLEGLGGWKR